VIGIETAAGGRYMAQDAVIGAIHPHQSRKYVVRTTLARMCRIRRSSPGASPPIMTGASAPGGGPRSERPYPSKARRMRRLVRHRLIASTPMTRLSDTLVCR
jgi:hypothetical protein